MLGFVDVIDALGGLDVYVPKRITMPGNIQGGDTKYPDHLDPGWQKMNGTVALGFSRMRHDDSDYGRMARQRCLLASIAAQKSKATIASHWPALSKVIADRVRTSLTTEQLQTLLHLAGLGVNGVRTVALTPPLVPSGGWNARLVREIVESDPDFHVIDTAENGKVALQKVRLHKPDCILLDIEMPELSGLDTMRRLGLRSPSKIVILSSLGFEGSKERAEALLREVYAPLLANEVMVYLRKLGTVNTKVEGRIVAK